MGQSSPEDGLSDKELHPEGEVLPAAATWVASLGVGWITFRLGLGLPMKETVLWSSLAWAFVTGCGWAGFRSRGYRWSDTANLTFAYVLTGGLIWGVVVGGIFGIGHVAGVGATVTVGWGGLLLWPLSAAAAAALTLKTAKTASYVQSPRSDSG